MKKILIGVLVVVVVLLLAVRMVGDRDERLIRKTFAELASAAELDAKEDMIKGAIRARVVGGFFVPDLSVDVSGLPMNISSRADLITMIFTMRTRLDQLKLELRDIEVTVAPDRQTARLVVSARAHVTGLGHEDSLWKEAELDWVRSEDAGWQVAAMRSVDPIERR